jgi:hypothetical protein
MPIWLCLVGAWAEDEVLVREATGTVGAGEPAWIVRYEDGGPMDTPTFLQAVGSPEHQQAYKRLQSREVGAGVGLATGGSLLGLGGLTLLPVSVLEKDGRMALAGGALMLGGYAVFSLCRVPFVRHARRKQHPAEFFTLEEADQLIELHNRAPPGS